MPQNGAEIPSNDTSATVTSRHTSGPSARSVRNAVTNADCSGASIANPPRAAMAANQTTITGPKRRPTAPVPTRWSRNRTTMMTTVMGTT